MSLSIDFTFFRSPKISNNPHHSIDFNDEYDEYNPFCKTHIIGSAIKKDDTSNEALNIENDLTLFLVNDDLENPQRCNHISPLYKYRNYCCSDSHKKLWKQLENDIESYITMIIYNSLYFTNYFTNIQTNSNYYNRLSSNNNDAYIIMHINNFNVSIYMQIISYQSMMTYECSYRCIMLQVYRR